MIDKTKANLIQNDIQAALQAVADKHNLTMQLKGGSYSDSVFTCKGVLFADKTATGAADTNPVYFEDTKRFGFLYGITTEDIGKKFKVGVQDITLAGMKSRKWIIFDGVHKGKQGHFKYRPDHALQLMAKPQTAYSTMLAR